MRFETFYPTDHGELCSDFAGQAGIATVAGAQSLGFRLRLDRSDIDDLDPSGFRQTVTQLICEPRQARLLIGARTVCRAFETCIDQSKTAIFGSAAQAPDAISTSGSASAIFRRPLIFVYCRICRYRPRSPL
jgi:hypothetical protein